MEKTTTLTSNTLLPIGAFVAALTLVVGLTWWAAALDTQVRITREITTSVVHELKEVNATLARLEERQRIKEASGK
jgi:hypothetical protein